MARKSFFFVLMTGVWTEVGELRFPRRYASTVPLDDTRTWISGGYNGLNKVDSSDIFENGQATEGPRLPTTLWQHCSVR